MIAKRAERQRDVLKGGRGPGPAEHSGHSQLAGVVPWHIIPNVGFRNSGRVNGINRTTSCGHLSTCAYVSLYLSIYLSSYIYHLF